MENQKTKIQADIVEKLDSPAHGILLLAPRMGKTKIAIDIIKKEKPETILWVTPSVKLRDIDIPKEFITWKAKDYLPKVTVVCWKSLSKFVGFYDKIILDEYQYITSDNTRNLCNRKLLFHSILCLSGTHPKRSREKSDILSQLKLKILNKIDIEQAVEKELISDYNITVIETDLNNSHKYVKAGSKANPFYVTESQQYDYLSKTCRQKLGNSNFSFLKRMQLIYNSISKEEVAQYLIKNLKGRKLIFAGSIEQSKRLSPHVYNSKTDDKKLNMFLNQEIDILSCVRAGGVGFTYKNVDHFIIVQSDSDNNGETTQKLSRSLLSQKDYKANIYFIVLSATQDDVWLDETLKGFDQNKIKRKRFIHIQNEEKI
jgi:superfamily II DNA or RNA helicase